MRLTSILPRRGYQERSGEQNRPPTLAFLNSSRSPAPLKEPLYLGSSAALDRYPRGLPDMSLAPFPLGERTVELLKSYIRPVPQRRWRNRSQGENKILSASKPITTITSMMPIT